MRAAVILSLGLWALSMTPAAARAQSIAFFYGARLPPELARAYDEVVVEPAHGMSPADARGTRLVAYVAIGEVSDASPERGRLREEWVLGRNAAWKSSVIDLRARGFQRDLIERRFEGLWQRGYRAFFLDTLDSYQQVVKEPAGREEQRRALVEVLRALHARHPDAQLLLNRGFELLDDVAGSVSGVVAESLFHSFDAASGSYQPTTAADQAWLLARMREVRLRHRLRAIVIDYAPHGQRELARALARRIAEQGLTPWVADGALSTVGVGSAELLPRRVLVLVQRARGPALPDALRYVAPVLEHLGYAVEAHDLGAGLPEPVPGTLAAIVTWLVDAAELPAGYGRFLRVQSELGVRLVVFGQPGLTPEDPDATALGLHADPGAVSPGGAALTVERRDALARFEAEPVPSPLTLLPWRVEGDGVQTHLSFRTARGAEVQALVSTRWGAWASSHYFAPRGLAGERAWTIDPFALFEHVLAGRALPAPDLSTENGARLALFVLRVQGLASASRLVDRPPIATLFSDLLARYPVPHALELGASAHNQPSAADQRVGRALAKNPLCKDGVLPPGSTRLSDAEPWLTQLRPLSVGALTFPMANDYAYLPANAGESHAYRLHAETMERSGAPRRLLPVALDYHASSLASDGGWEAVQSLYARAFSGDAMAIDVDRYRAAVEAFDQLVLLRTHDGAFRVAGPHTLRTLRLPTTLGALDLARSQGVAVLNESVGARWVTFLPDGERSLSFADTREPNPAHLTYANAAVQSFVRVQEGHTVRLQFQLEGYMPVRFALAGLPPDAPCELRTGKQRSSHRSDAAGELRLGITSPRASIRLLCERKAP